MTPVRLEPVASRSGVKHSMTEPLRSGYNGIMVRFIRKVVLECFHSDNWLFNSKLPCQLVYLL